VFVPDGEHEVDLRFGPAAWWAGLWISAASAMILGVVGLAAVRRQRSGRRSDSQTGGGGP
jgi:hypothetical protein